MINTANIILNLGILGIFKYFNFFLDNITTITSACGIHMDYVTINIILPVGISFYTFQALSYTIDVYQNKTKATHDIIEFFAYISFFPQLVAGPIERATHLLPQFQKERYFDYAKAVDGLRQMLWGFFKKIVIADNCAVIVDNYWGYHDILSGRMLILLGVLFAFQIYCDFSGYSDIAIGCARLFGFNLAPNFKTPYLSRSIPDFWRRWHISLMTWFRDYLYFPLGGNRYSKWKACRNVLVVWILSGLWHGANWTFIVWGLYHATLLIIYNMNSHRVELQRNLTRNRIITNIIRLLQTATTFSLVIIGWMIFRAENISQAWRFISSIFTHSFMGLGFIDGRKWLMAGICIMIIEWFQRNRSHALDFSIKGIFHYRLARWFIYYILIYLIFNYAGQNQAFIYFQF
jgi:D-alanyl-lipoteichoic acid acyltransferase DltB (MBOAT superfamily)